MCCNAHFYVTAKAIALVVLISMLLVLCCHYAMTMHHILAAGFVCGVQTNCAVTWMSGVLI